MLNSPIQVLHQHPNTAREVLTRFSRHRYADQQCRDRLGLVLQFILCFLTRIPDQSLDQTRVIQLHDALIQLHLIHPGAVLEQLLTVDGLLNHHLPADHVHTALRLQLVLIMQCHRVRIQRVLGEAIPQTLGIILHIQAPRLPVHFAQCHTEQPCPQIPALHRLSVDALDLGRRPPVTTPAHHTTHRVIRTTNPVLRHRSSLVQLLIEAHRRLRHLDRGHPIRQDLTGREPQVDTVRQLPLRSE